MTTSLIKVLMVDDDADQLELYRTQFEMSGVDIMTELSGRDALAKAVAWQPDLILLDVIMETQNGIEVLKSLKTNDKTSHIPVVMFSNTHKKELIDEARKEGAVAFWEKTKTLPKDLIVKCKAIVGDR